MSKKRKFPRRPEQFKLRCERLVAHCADPNARFIMKIEPMANMECQLVVESYYGGKWGAVREMFKQALHQSVHDNWFGFLIWFSDTVGWTKLVDVPETATHHAYKMRHGKKCHGSPNCSQDCISLAQPKWFKKLMGKEDL